MRLRFMKQMLFERLNHYFVALRKHDVALCQIELGPEIFA